MDVSDNATLPRLAGSREISASVSPAVGSPLVSNQGWYRGFGQAQSHHGTKTEDSLALVLFRVLRSEGEGGIVVAKVVRTGHS